MKHFISEQLSKKILFLGVSMKTKGGMTAVLVSYNKYIGGNLIMEKQTTNVNLDWIYYDEDDFLDDDDNWLDDYDDDNFDDDDDIFQTFLDIFYKIIENSLFFIYNIVVKEDFTWVKEK